MGKKQKNSDDGQQEDSLDRIIGKIELDVDDASINHGKYLYGNK